jgi:hypothetical protein
LAAAAAAVLTFGVTPAPAAKADIDDLFQPIIDAIGQATFDAGLDADSVAAPALAATDSVDLLASGDPFASLDDLLTGWYQAIVYDPLQQLGLVDDGGASTTVGAVAAETGAPTTDTVPLQINGITEPVVDISVSGGRDIPVVLDTGSNGLVIPWYDLGLQDLGFPTGLGIGQYSGGLDYVYLTLPATVDFGNGIETTQTPVEAVLFTFPTSLQNLFNPAYYSLPNFLGVANADGVLGLGPNAVGPMAPGTPVVTAALPDGLNQGVLIDEPDHQLVFGPNPLTDGISVDGPVNANLEVSINGGTPQPVSAIIDSGGVYGTLPSSLFGGDGVGDVLKPGTEVSVYTSDGELLYSYTTTATNTPTVISGDTMNTGYYPFAHQPIYIDTTGSGTTIFGDPH